MLGRIPFVLLVLAAQDPPRPYRLESVDLKKTILWGAECRRPDGTGLDSFVYQITASSFAMSL